MKKNILQLVVPVTIISFFGITKWWYTLPVDAPDTIYMGFPLVHTGPGWHTSLSLQVFIGEMIFDFLVYFLIWLTIIYLINRFLFKIQVPKFIKIVTYTFAILILGFNVLLYAQKDNLFYIKRNYPIEVMQTGVHFFWQKEAKPDFYNYHPERKQVQP